MNKPFRLFKVPSDKPDYYCYCLSDVNGKTVHTYVPKTTFSRAIAAHNLGIRNYDLPSHSRQGVSRLIWLEIQNLVGTTRRCLTTAHLQPARELELKRNGWTVLSTTPVPLNEVI